jgi:uncharacterized Zn finger protein (UPF0148 family)
MARFTSKTNSLERISSYGQTISCPVCNNPFMLKDTKDGDQAYWCHTCERGWRAGHLPPEARVARKVLSHEQEARVARKVLSHEQEARVARKVLSHEQEAQRTKAKALLEAASLFESPQTNPRVQQSLFADTP